MAVQRNAAARRVRLGESPLYRDLVDLTAARRARAPEGTNPTAPRVLWASDPSRPAGRRAVARERRRALAEKRKSMLRTLDGGMLVFAHRGSPLDEAENSWKGYVRAADHGAHGIEGDVGRVKDRFGNWHLVDFHDDTKDRVTDQRGRLDETTLEETQELRVTHPRGNAATPRARPGCPGGRISWASCARIPGI